MQSSGAVAAVGKIIDENARFTIKAINEDLYLVPKDAHKFTIIWLHGLG